MGFLKKLFGFIYLAIALVIIIVPLVMPEWAVSKGSFSPIPSANNKSLHVGLYSYYLVDEASGLKGQSTKFDYDSPDMLLICGTYCEEFEDGNYVTSIMMGLTISCIGLSILSLALSSVFHSFGAVGHISTFVSSITNVSAIFIYRYKSYSSLLITHENRLEYSFWILVGFSLYLFFNSLFV